MKFTHIDLFSGIGGFARAAQQVWGKDYHNLFFCEIDKYCQAVLRKNFGKEILIYDDIKKVRKEQFVKDTFGGGLIHGKTEEEKTKVRRQRESSTGDGVGFRDEETASDPKESGQLREAKSQNDGKNSKGGRRYDPTDKTCDPSDPDKYRLQESGTEQQAGGDRQLSETVTDTEGGKSREPAEPKGRENISGRDFQVDLLTAGPPCQPASQAGKRGGDKDDRWLWEEMFTVIQEFKPTWCVIENVYGLVSLQQGVVFDSLLAKMEGLNYEVQPIIVGAVGKNAPHKRYRVWFIAHAIDSSNRTDGRTVSEKDGLQGVNREKVGGRVSTGAVVESSPNPEIDGSGRDGGAMGKTKTEPQGKNDGTEFVGGSENDSDPKHEGRVRRGSTGNSDEDGIHEGEQAGQDPRGTTARCGEEYANAGNPKSPRGFGKKVGEVSEGESTNSIGSITDARNPERAGQQGGFDGQGQEQYGRTGTAGFEGWDRDWYEVATEFCGIYDGFSDWIHRYFDRVIFKEDYATTTKENRIEGMRILREGISSKEIWKKLGRLFKVDEKEILFTFLCGIEEGANRQDNVSSPCEKSEEEGGVQNLWKKAIYRQTSQRWKHQEQFCRELINIMPSLSYEIALEVTKIWDYLSCSYSSMMSSVVKQDNFELTKAQHRVERLKALGNAVVVPLVAELLGFIKQADENPVEDGKEGKRVNFINITEDKNGNYFAIKDLRNWSKK